jgi:hypothetical protein
MDLRKFNCITPEILEFQNKADKKRLKLKSDKISKRKQKLDH